MEKIYYILGFITFWAFVCGTISGIIALVVSYYKEKKRFKNLEEKYKDYEDDDEV